MEKTESVALTGAPTPDHELPSYAHVRNEQQKQSNGGVAGDAGTSGSGLAREHHKFLETGKGKKWLSMFVKSRATSAASLPVFFEGDTIFGRVELDLDKAESSKGVSITVSATCIPDSLLCRFHYAGGAR